MMTLVHFSFNRGWRFWGVPTLWATGHLAHSLVSIADGDSGECRQGGVSRAYKPFTFQSRMAILGSADHNVNLNVTKLSLFQSRMAILGSADAHNVNLNVTKLSLFQSRMAILGSADLGEVRDCMMTEGRFNRGWRFWGVPTKTWI